MNETVDIEMKRTVPIMRVVGAAIIDMHEDVGKVQETFTHWAARGLKKLNRETLNMGVRRIILNINPNTRTATLPLDWHEEIVIDPIVNGRRTPMKLKSRNDLMPYNTEEEVCEDKCPLCNQDKAICNDLTVTEDTELVQVGDEVATKTTVKRLYPNGDYMLEITFPVRNLATDQIEYTTTKEFITCFDMKQCGCVDLTDDTVAKIECFCPDVFCQHLAPCDCDCSDDVGGYKIFESLGLIQFDRVGKFTKVYCEYRGFLPKKNGQYHVPEIAFETLVEWTKYKNVEGRKSEPQWRIERFFQSYMRERGNMEKIKGRISLSVIMNAALTIPSFDREDPRDECCFVVKPVQTIANGSTHQVCDAPVTPASSVTHQQIFSGGLVGRYDWPIFNGSEGATIISPELKDKRLIYFNIENNDSWHILTNGAAPTFRQITFDSVTGSIRMPFPVEADQFAYAIYANKITTVSDIAPSIAQYNTLNDWWTTVPNQNYVEVGAIPSAVKGYIITANDIDFIVTRGGAEYNLVTSTPVGMQVRFDQATLRFEFENDFFPGETISVKFKRIV